MIIKNKSTVLKTFYVFFIVISCLAVPKVMSDGHRQVFILHSYSQHYPWTESQHNSFVSTLSDSEFRQVIFKTEYLDTKRLNYDEAYKEMFSAYLKSKYELYTPDLIYITDDNALDFVTSYLPAHFNVAPVIYSGINDLELINSLDSNKFVGILEKKDIEKNLDLLNAFDENIQNIVVLGDATNTYFAIKRDIEGVLKTKLKIKTTYIEEKNIERLLSELKNRNEKYLILTTVGGITDNSGRVIQIRELLNKIVALDKFIIISMEDSYLYAGVLGGYVSSGLKKGAHAAQLAQAYFSGQAISSLFPVTGDTNSYIFDYQLLEKYNFTLPENIKRVATILNEPLSLYERYRPWIIGTLVALVLTIVVLLAVFVRVLSRKNKLISSRTQLIESKELQEIERLKKVEKYQDALVVLSRGSFESLTEEFEHVAKISSETLGIKQVGIWLYNEDNSGIVCQSLYRSGSGHLETGTVLHRTDFPKYFEAVDTGRMLTIDNANTDPITAEMVDVYLVPNEITSMLDAPIFYQGKCMGVVCHEHMGEQRNWTLDEQEFAYAVAKTVSLLLEISKRKEIETILEHQANHDTLTNLPNRALLVDRLDQAVLQASRNDHLVAILFFDLDNFKIINDSFGHAIGDEVLIRVSQLLKTNFRDMDTIARMGGDEFVMILQPFDSINQVTATTTAIYELLQKPIGINGRELYVTSSIGVSVFPHDGRTSELLIKNADAAMYHAKEIGRNSFQFYTQEMTDKAMKRNQVGASLRKALESEEFVVHYQPQYNVKLKKLVGFEALVRWQHPDRGLLFPYEFLDVAEEVGLIVQIDRFVMVSSLRLFKKWRQQGLDVGVLSLNLTMRQLDQDDFFSVVSKCLSDNDFNPEWLSFEITESSIMKNPDKTIYLLEQLSNLGISLAIDDFGTGYSSLEYLKRLPVDKLKIDKSFIRDVLKDDGDAQIIQAVIALAKSLKLNVIAEGVEELAQMEFLLNNGCSEAQGYYYGRPMDAAKIEKSSTKMINFDLDLPA